MHFYCHSGNDCAYDGIFDTMRAGETKKIDVKTTTIDNFVEKNKIRKIDILKIDTEGSELFVLLGAKNTLLKLRPIILFEAHPINMRACCSDYKKLYFRKINNDYTITSLHGNKLSLLEFEHEVNLLKNNFLAVPVQTAKIKLK